MLCPWLQPTATLKRYLFSSISHIKSDVAYEMRPTLWHLTAKFHPHSDAAVNHRKGSAPDLGNRLSLEAMPLSARDDI